MNRIRSILSHSGFQRYFFNTWWIFGEKILRILSGVFVGAYVARYLGPSQYGLLNYALSLVSIPTVIAALGLDVIVVRELVRQPERANVILGTAFGLKMIGIFIVFTLLLAGTYVVADVTETALIIYIVSLSLLFEGFRVIEFFFLSRVMSKYVVISQIISLLIVSVTRVSFVLSDAPLIWFAWSYAADLFIFASSMVYLYRSNGFQFSLWKFSAPVAKELLRYSWPMIFSSLAITVYMKIDQVMVKLILGDEANGFYGVAVRLGEMWNFLPVAICTSLFPAVLNARLTDEKLYMNRLQHLFDLMVVLAISISVFMTFFAGYITGILFGEAYAASGPIIVLYTWSSVFVFLGVAIGRWMLAENLQFFGMLSFIFAAILNVVLNYFLIESMGLTGAALSTLISYSFAAYFGLLFTGKTRKMFQIVTQSLNIFSLMSRSIREFKALDKV